MGREPGPVERSQTVNDYRGYKRTEANRTQGECVDAFCQRAAREIAAAVAIGASAAGFRKGALCDKQGCIRYFSTCPEDSFSEDSSQKTVAPGTVAHGTVALGTVASQAAVLKTVGPKPKSGAAKSVAPKTVAAETAVAKEAVAKAAVAKTIVAMTIAAKRVASRMDVQSSVC